MSTVIYLETLINAGTSECFDLSRSVSIHLDSMKNSNERVIAGRNSGLFELNDRVTWEAKHFGITQQLTVEITAMQPYRYFEDRMVKGIFKRICHEHWFVEQEGSCIMKDIFEYEVPGWLIGKLFDKLVLKRYMTKLLTLRNLHIKFQAEHKSAQH